MWLLTMIRRYFIIHLALILFNVPLNAQFINIQIKIEPELSAVLEQELAFGDVVANSGVQNIELGDFNMGIFRIRAFYSQSIFVNLNVPNALESNNNFGDDQIPITLFSAFNNSGENNATNAIELNNNAGYIPMTDNIFTQNTNQIRYWQELYLYVYGYIDVGQVSDGFYEGDVVLSVTYD